MKLPSRILSMIPGRFLRSPKPVPSIRLQVLNLTRSTVLGSCLEVACSGAKRNKGLLGRKQLSEGEGLWIIPCEAIHTIGMQFPIDLVYLDNKHRIKKLRSNVTPWRFSACMTAHSVLELASGTICDTHTSIGDVLDFSASPLTEDDPL